MIRPEVHDLFKGCDLIIHAGDIIKEDDVYELETICPVKAVRGNNDFLLNTDVYPHYNKFIINDKIRFYVVHDLKDMYEDYSNYDVIIHGHTHNPKEEYRDNTLVLNPGSFGPKRFSLPISLATITIDNNILDVQFFNI